jgi:hypothetical protein
MAQIPAAHRTQTFAAGTIPEILVTPMALPYFGGLVRTDNAPRKNGLASVSSFAFCVSHELAEALTNPDTKGTTDS